MVSPGAVFAPAFLASAVEAIEMAVIVIGVGATRGWRWTLTGAAGGAAVLAVLVAGLGRALTVVPISSLRLVVGGLLLVFGLQWLRKGIRRVAANGLAGYQGGVGLKAAQALEVLRFQQLATGCQGPGVLGRQLEADARPGVG